MSILLYCDLNDYSPLDNSSEWNLADKEASPFIRNNFPTTQSTNASSIGPDKYFMFSGGSSVDIQNGEITIPFTINFWAYLNNSSQGGNVLNNNENSFIISIYNQKLKVENSLFLYTIPLNKWININLEYTLDNKVKLSVNGNYEEELSRTNSFITSSIYKMLNGYSGGLAWLRVYDEILSAEKIKGLYESCMTLSSEGIFGVNSIKEVISLTEDNPISLRNSLTSKKSSYATFHGEYVQGDEIEEGYIFPANETYNIKNLAPLFSGTITASTISIPSFSLPYSGNLVAFIIDIKPSSSVTATFSSKSGSTSFNTRSFTGLSTSSFNRLLYLTKPKTLNIDTIFLSFSTSTTIQYQNYKVLFLTSDRIENYLENNNIVLGMGTGLSYYNVDSLLSWCDSNLKPLVFTNNESSLLLPSIAIEKPNGSIFNTDRKYGGTAFMAEDITEFIFPEQVV